MLRWYWRNGVADGVRFFPSNSLEREGTRGTHSAVLLLGLYGSNQDKRLLENSSGNPVYLLLLILLFAWVLLGLCEADHWCEVIAEDFIAVNKLFLLFVYVLLYEELQSFNIQNLMYSIHASHFSATLSTCIFILPADLGSHQTPRGQEWLCQRSFSVHFYKVSIDTGCL